MLQALGPLGSPPAILLWLLAIAAIVLVGRFLLNVAWKLVVIASIAVATLWVLGALGYQFGILAIV